MSWKSVDISDRNEMTEEEKNFRGIEDAEGNYALCRLLEI